MTAGLLGAAVKTSLSAAVMLLAIMVLRLRFQDRTPRRAFCLLWDIVLVRLLVLAEIPSPVSIRRWLPVLSEVRKPFLWRFPPSPRGPPSGWTTTAWSRRRMYPL